MLRGEKEIECKKFDKTFSSHGNKHPQNGRSAGECGDEEVEGMICRGGRGKGPCLLILVSTQTSGDIRILVGEGVNVI